MYSVQEVVVYNNVCVVDSRNPTSSNDTHCPYIIGLTVLKF